MIDTLIKTIIVCGIIRNAGKHLKTNIPVIMDICSHFKDYKIVIYENGSVDQTKDILNSWHKANPNKVFILTGKYDAHPIPSHSDGKCNPFFSKQRIKKMAALRNKYLEFVDDNKWNPDYMMVVDMDVAHISAGGFLSSFKLEENWDAVTAYGYSMSPTMKKRYHDTYALVEIGEEMTPQTEDSIYSKSLSFVDKLKKREPVLVYSAFGGLAIYHYEFIKGLKYQVIPNDDDRVESRCEHFSIYQQMRSNGHTKVYVNPMMEVKYQSVNFDLIIRTIRRWIFQ